ncbi:NAD kinase [Micropruina sonneratiae]|uniref:NAD kinase n=1 Tax=Micropruina sonneratiae TaxID=2986940 RepID=UPI00222737AC|nr:NAD kinase [Micropruina sp. KQZ13P-5]MCW3157970.1 NAD kinase [Micropruina sp. KQZ13P-5]
MGTSRFVTVALHAGRQAALDAAAGFIAGMTEHGITCLLDPGHRTVLGGAGDTLELTAETGRRSELVVVFGGDGSILRAAEWALPLDIPVLGVNLGHIGFLAELESHQAGSLISHVVGRNYTVEERMTIDTIITDADGAEVWRSFAINEVSIEKLARQRMIEVLVRVDGRALSRWGTDGVLVATPTGSTAYAFSANGPVLWPDIDALLLVPLSAHALFNRPLVIGPHSTASIEILPSNESQAVVWCDGRRTIDISAGMLVTAQVGTHRLRLARISERPFVDRLVRKFELPVEGWRGVAQRQQHAD